MQAQIRRVHDETATAFFKEVQREARSTFWNFSVVWHEQTHDVVAVAGEEIVGAARVRIAASLAHIEAVVVKPAYRRHGIARSLLTTLEEVSNYYNCHKMTIEVPHRSAAQTFFERCGYKEEAVLPQHTWKIDCAVLRKFLL